MLTVTDNYKHNTIASFFVPGTPAGQGSKRSVGNNQFIESSKHTMPWRHTIAATAGQYITAPSDKALIISCTFYFPRPKVHYTSKGILKATAPRFKVTDPDLDKLLRAVGDALSRGLAYFDDNQIIHWDTWKLYCDRNEQPGLRITLIEIT